MNTTATDATRLTGWVAIFGGVFAYLNLVFAIMVMGDDTGITLHGATMLALPSDARMWMRLSMLSDILGFYLAVLVIGAYLWHRFRVEAGALGDMAVLVLVVYAGVGISGAAIQLATLDPLMHLHAGGDSAVRAATEAAWTAIAYASQKGLWWVEGPLVLFWGLVVAAQLKRAGWGRWASLMLTIVGWSYALFFVFAFLGVGDLAELIGTVGVFLFPLWMLLFGWKLLRQPALAAA